MDILEYEALRQRLFNGEDVPEENADTEEEADEEPEEAPEQEADEDADNS